MRKRTFLLGLSAAAVLAGCAQAPIKVAKPFPSLPKIAVLPMDNQTVNLDGPTTFRKEMANQLGSKGYSVLPLGPLDDQLRTQFSITDGGQLPSVDPKALGKGLGVDGLLYGELIKFSDQDLGYYWKRSVEAHMRLLRSDTAEVVWEDDQTCSTQKFALNKDDAKKLLALGTAQKLIEKATHKELIPETKCGVGMLLKSLPHP